MKSCYPLFLYPFIARISIASLVKNEIDDKEALLLSVFQVTKP
jgi:hypothetical protein